MSKISKKFRESVIDARGTEHRIAESRLDHASHCPPAFPWMQRRLERHGGSASAFLMGRRSRGWCGTGLHRGSRLTCNLLILRYG
jgi:hypothetical protein